MALEQKLHLKLSQKLIMTPSLQQAIKRARHLALMDDRHLLDAPLAAELRVTKTRRSFLKGVLATGVAAPRPDEAVRAQRHGVPVAARDGALPPQCQQGPEPRSCTCGQQEVRGVEITGLNGTTINGETAIAFEGVNSLNGRLGTSDDVVRISGDTDRSKEPFVLKG